MADTLAAAAHTTISALPNVNVPPYFTGTLPLDRNISTLYFRAGGKAEMIDFTQATDPQLAALASACQPASFGVANNNVLDESYRKAGKMDSSEFATQFSPTSSGIMEGIQKSLFAGRTIKSELYKLNIYGPGSFFKAHVDTPRSMSMVGSLVVVLPTKHEGGSLLFRHGGREFVFDSANAVATAGDGAPRAAFVAFYSDVEHEVSTVTSGYRVTLTYNLYLATSDPSTVTESTLSPELNADMSEFSTQMKTTLKGLLNNPTFFPQGGYLGFGLSHRYPFTTNTGLSMIKHSLKGTDATLTQICEEIELDCELKAVYTNENAKDVWALVDKFPRFCGGPVEDTEEGEDDSEIIAHLREEGYDPLVVFNVLKQRSYNDGNAQPILWMRPLTSVNKLETAYVAYGNEASLAYAYGHVCLVARVPTSSQRH